MVTPHLRLVYQRQGFLGPHTPPVHARRETSETPFVRWRVGSGCREDRVRNEREGQNKRETFYFFSVTLKWGWCLLVVHHLKTTKDVPKMNCL